MFTPFNIKNVNFKNRFIMTAINTGFIYNNELSDKVLNFYSERIKNEISAITTICAVNNESSYNNMPFNGYGYDRFCNGISDISKKYNCNHIVQLFHYGSGSLLNSEKRNKFLVSNLTVEYINSIIYDYSKSAQLCSKNGVDIIEIDIGHGMILEFISNLTNNRTDIYGGSIENRMRFLTKILESIKSITNNIPIILKISNLSDLIIKENIMNFSDIINIIKFLENKNMIDAINIDSEYIFKINENTKLPIISEHIFDYEYDFNMKSDFIGISKSIISDKAIVNKIYGKKLYNICQCCNKCEETFFNNKELYCPYNPEVGLEYSEILHKQIATAKKIVIAGGGIAGIMAAKKSAERGYKTIIVTNNDDIGGRVNMISLIPEKRNLKKLVENLKYELNELGVEFIYNKTVDFNAIKQYSPYFVVLSMGATQNVPRIFDNTNYILVNDIFNCDEKLFDNIKNGNNVIIGDECISSNIINFLNYKLNCEYKYIIIDSNDIYNVSENKIILNNNIEYEYDNIIILDYFESVNISDISEQLMNERISYAVIGDNNSVRNIEYALKDAFDLFLRLYIV